MATEAKSTEDVRAALLAETQKKIDEQNAALAGKGLRFRVGQTRGKNPQVITWKAFDESKPETLPESLKEFSDLSGVGNDAKVLLSLLIDGFNASQYSAASDPIAEYVEPTWTDDNVRQFRLAVRNYASLTGASIEDSVKLIKPGVMAAFAKAASEAAEPKSE